MGWEGAAAAEFFAQGSYSLTGGVESAEDLFDSFQGGDVEEWPGFRVGRNVGSVLRADEVNLVIGSKGFGVVSRLGGATWP